jgi:hypothetical protein
MRKLILTLTSVFIATLFMFSPAESLHGKKISEPAFVKRSEGKVFIKDRRGELWDVTQAESLGFKPGEFQHGIGRDAFTTLDDSLLTSGDKFVPENLRIIGISEGEEAKAYSVPKFMRHEISNSRLDGKPVAVGY